MGCGASVGAVQKDSTPRSPEGAHTIHDKVPTAQSEKTEVSTSASGNIVTADDTGKDVYKHDHLRKSHHDDSAFRVDTAKIAEVVLVKEAVSGIETLKSDRANTLKSWTAELGPLAAPMLLVPGHLDHPATSADYYLFESLLVVAATADMEKTEQTLLADVFKVLIDKSCRLVQRASSELLAIEQNSVLDDVKQYAQLDLLLQICMSIWKAMDVTCHSTNEFAYEHWDSCRILVDTSKILGLLQRLTERQVNSLGGLEKQEACMSWILRALHAVAVRTDDVPRELMVAHSVLGNSINILREHQKSARCVRESFRLIHRLVRCSKAHAVKLLQNYEANWKVAVLELMLQSMTIHQDDFEVQNEAISALNCMAADQPSFLGALTEPNTYGRLSPHLQRCLAQFTDQWFQLTVKSFQSLLAIGLKKQPVQSRSEANTAGGKATVSSTTISAEATAAGTTVDPVHEVIPMVEEIAA